MIVIWKKNGLRLRVLDVAENQDGAPCYSVCKETAPSDTGRFLVRQDDVEADFK